MCASPISLCAPPPSALFLSEKDRGKEKAQGVRVGFGRPDGGLPESFFPLRTRSALSFDRSPNLFAAHVIYLPLSKCSFSSITTPRTLPPEGCHSPSPKKIRLEATSDHKVWERSPSVWKIGLIVFFCSILTAYLWLLVSMAVFRRLGWMDSTTPPLHQYLIQTFKGTLTHHKPFLFLSWSALYFGIKYWRQSQQEQQQALRAAALAKEAELQMLRYQLNPHFLFNSLNSASALIRENPARAEKMIGELSELLRHSLANGKAGDAPLSDELEAARNYLEIEKIRVFGNCRETLQHLAV
jgi:Histidine kinase